MSEKAIGIICGISLVAAMVFQAIIAMAIA